jgi:hypothetical protein
MVWTIIIIAHGTVLALFFTRMNVSHFKLWCKFPSYLKQTAKLYFQRKIFNCFLFQFLLISNLMFVAHPLITIFFFEVH